MIYLLIIALLIVIFVFLQINSSRLSNFAPDGDRRAAAANVYVDRGTKKFQAGNHRGAIADYDEALRIKPDYALAFYNRGVLKGKLRDRQGAISDLSEAARLSKLQGQMDEHRNAIALLEILNKSS
jgi:tetratricopeptide (TPR) repeat protein